MRDERNLYNSVVKNSKYGYYELSKEFRRSMGDFYSDRYYQDDYSVYRHIKYDEIDMNKKKYFYAQKNHVFQSLFGKGGYRQSLLDIGTGEGYALAFFNNLNWKVLGIDYSLYGLEEHNPSMKKYLKQGDYYEIINELHREGVNFDFINADYVLEHLPEPDRFFDIIKKVSHKETLVCVTVPNEFSLIQKLAFEIGHIDEAFWVTKDTSEHFNYFSLASLCLLGEDKGYKKILATADWPIDFFLLHDNTNYRNNNKIGHDCHVACTLLENSIYAESMDKAIEFFSAMAEVGMGRQVSVYFKLFEG